MQPRKTETRSATAPKPLTSRDARALVRKSLQGETLVADWSEASDVDQKVTVRWPRSHAFYIQDGRYSPLLFTESVRQALALLSHSVHQIPLSHRLSWEYVRSTVNPEALQVDSRPVDVTLRVTHPLVKRRRLGSVHLTSRIEGLRSGVPVGAAELRYTAHPPALYDRLRGQYANAERAFARALPSTLPVPAPRVGRSLERDVVLSPTKTMRKWQLRMNVDHEILFDHPHDHVPGMVLLEAVNQATQAAMEHPVVPIASDTVFFRYVELDRPCLIVAEPGLPDSTGGRQVKVTASQEERTVFSSTVTTVRSPRCPGRAGQLVIRG